MGRRISGATGLRGRLLRLVLAIIVFLSAWVSQTFAAYAQTPAAEGPTAQTRAIAQKLFETAMTAMAAAQYDDACPKLEEVVRLIPETLGAKMKLAECYEKSGRFASAWATYGQAAANARSSEQSEREAEATAGESRVSRLISYLTIDVSSEIRALEELEVRLDGQLIPPVQWGISLPLDGGEHFIAVAARGRKTWGKSVKIETSGTMKLVVEQLEAEIPHVSFDTVQVDFLSPSDKETWLLMNADGNEVCRLPCRQWVKPNAGFFLQQEIGGQGNFDHRIRIPGDVAYFAEHGALIVTPRVKSAAHGAGLVLLVVGSCLAATGLVVLPIDHSGVRGAGLTGASVGAAVAATGIVMVTVSRGADGLEIEAPDFPPNISERTSNAAAPLLIGPGSLAASF